VEISALQERLRNVREYVDDSFEDWHVTMVNFKAMLPATITAIQNLERHCKLGPFAETVIAVKPAVIRRLAN
jgi:hypothetical protein